MTEDEKEYTTIIESLLKASVLLMGNARMTKEEIAAVLYEAADKVGTGVPE